MSQSGSIQNGKMKIPDDPNVKILRELSNLPYNKNCFDCGQRGPTYVNITIGSFVCMTCSGLLRGLTPPHRVKSISMASFTLEEIESLKSKGNEFCRKVWLATCTENSLPGSEKDPDRVTILRNFMSIKYEQKRFYIDPSKLSETELGKIQAETVTATSSASHHQTVQQKSPSCYQRNKPSPTSKIRNTNQILLSQTTSRLPSSITLPDIKSLTSLVGPNAPPMIHELDSKTHPNLPISQKYSANNLNGHINTVDFANFEDAFSEKQLESNNSDFFPTNNQSNFSPYGKSMQIPILPYNNGHPNIVSSSPINNQSCNTDCSHSSNIKTSNTSAYNEDKYAALKDLDSLFKQTTTNQDGSISEKGLPSSASLPSNLSSSEWFPSASNPFVQVSSQDMWNVKSPYNPFSGTIKSLESSNGTSNLKYPQITGGKINPFESFTSNPKNPFL